MRYLPRQKAFEKALDAAWSAGKYINEVWRNSCAAEGQNANILEEFVKPGREFVEAIYSDEAIDMAGKLDSAGFAEYYNMIGELAIRLDLPEAYYFRGAVQPVTKENLEAALEAASTAAGKVEILKGFHAGELSGLDEKYKGKLIKEIEEGWFIGGEDREEQIKKLEAKPDIDFPKIFVYVYRNIESYKTINQKNPELKGKDRLLFINNVSGERLEIPITSVPTMKNTKVEKAVAPGDIELTLGPEKGSNYSPNVLTISGGKLLSGDMLKEEGTTANDPIPWRVHDTLYFGSEGCFVGRKDNPKGSVANVIDKLKFWGVEYGDKIQGKLLIEIDGRVYGGQ